MRYLCETRKEIAEHWYPKDSAKRARVDEYLDWHFTVTRQGIGMYIARTINFPLIFGIFPHPETISYAEFVMKRTVIFLDRKLETQKYVAGNEMTIADLSCIAEFTMQAFIPDHPFILSIPEKYPNFNRWYLEISNIPEIVTNDAKMRELGGKVQPKRKELEKKRQAEMAKL